MKVKVDPSLMSLSGRWTKKDTTCIALNKKTGKMHQYVINDEANYPNTANQQQVTAIFTARARAASYWWKQNKPSTNNPQGTEDYRLVKAAYDHQNKYGNIYTFVRSLVKGVVPQVQVPGQAGNINPADNNEPISD